MKRNLILCSPCFDLRALKREGGENIFDAGFADDAGFCAKCQNEIVQYVKENPPNAPWHTHDPNGDAAKFNAKKKS